MRFTVKYEFYESLGSETHYEICDLQQKHEILFMIHF